MLRIFWCGSRSKTESGEVVRKTGKPSARDLQSSERVSLAKEPKAARQSRSQNVNAVATSATPATQKPAPSLPSASKKGSSSKEKRTATLQELASTYKRGAFDPTNPTGRLKVKKVERTSNSTPSPKTPEQCVTRDSIIRAEADSVSTSSESGDKDEKNIFSTRSTLSNATSGRPQPVAELQSLLRVTDPAQCPLKTEQSIQSLVSCKRTSPGPLSSAARKPGLEPASPLATGASQKEEQLNSKDSAKSKDSSRSKDSRRSKDSSKPRRMSQTVRQSLMRQQSIGTPIVMCRQAIEPYYRTMSATGPGQLEGHPYYKVLGSLTGGPASNVVVCLDQRTNEKIAIKMLTRGVTNSKAAEREIANLRLCAMHPYIIHMREVFLTSSHLAIAMDFAEGGNLATYIEMYQSSKMGKGISEERARLIFQQIVVAVEFCHNMGFANRDIKLDNVLLVPNGEDKAAIPTVKLSDFGFSKDEYIDSVCKTACGTPECVAPEILTGGLYEGKYSDIWSLGVLLYAMLTGNYPFSRPADKELEGNIAMKKLFNRVMSARYAMPQHISREAQDLLTQMLKVNPEERIPIVDVLKHPFFVSQSKKPHKIVAVNRSLLQVPDSMLTGFFKQTNEQISQILKQASQSSTQRPTKMG